MYCPKCGCEYREGFYVCSDCNVDLVLEKPNSIYANLFKRLGALLIDMVIVTILIVPFLYAFIFLMAIRDELVDPLMITIISSVIEFIPYWLYFSLFESSKFKGSVGKMIFKIIVVDYKGDRLSFKKATIRSFSKIISLMLGIIALIVVASSQKKQGIHDNIAKTIVLNAGYENELKK